MGVDLGAVEDSHDQNRLYEILKDLIKIYEQQQNLSGQEFKPYLDTCNKNKSHSHPQESPVNLVCTGRGRGREGELETPTRTLDSWG